LSGYDIIGSTSDYPDVNDPSWLKLSYQFRSHMTEF